LKREKRENKGRKKSSNINRKKRKKEKIRPKNLSTVALNRKYLEIFKRNIRNNPINKKTMFASMTIAAKRID
jgi:hypothetical protein